MNTEPMNALNALDRIAAGYLPSSEGRKRVDAIRAAVADAFAAMDAAVTRLDSIGCRASCAPNDDAETAGRELTRIMRDAYETRDTLRAALARVQGGA